MTNTYEVEVLTHINRTITVIAESEDDAMAQAEASAKLDHPYACLIEAIGVQKGDAPRNPPATTHKFWHHCGYETDDAYTVQVISEMTEECPVCHGPVRDENFEFIGAG